MALKANMIMFKIYIFYIHMHIQISWMTDRWSTESATVEKATGFQGAVIDIWL